MINQISCVMDGNASDEDLEKSRACSSEVESRAFVHSS